MIVQSIIVTYGDRFHLLEQVIYSCFRECIDQIIVVDNASEKNSRNKLINFEKQNKNRLKVIYLDENIGSAGGYKRGLEEVYNNGKSEFIWLLDDDNKPRKDSLKILVEFWTDLKDNDKKISVSLLSFRPDRKAYRDAIMVNNPNLVLGKENSFLGFHIIDLFNRFFKKRDFIEKNITSGKVVVAPYGGMFFHKDLIKHIKYPKEDFFVYADDHEWSYRITKNNGSIYLLLDSIIDDIDTSWHIRKKNISIFDLYLSEGNELRIYYSVRNRISFEQDIIKNMIIYKLNKNLFLFFLYILKNDTSRFELFRKAVDDGLNNRLGKIY